MFQSIIKSVGLKTELQFLLFWFQLETSVNALYQNFKNVRARKVEKSHWQKTCLFFTDPLGLSDPERNPGAQSPNWTLGLETQSKLWVSHLKQIRVSQKPNWPMGLGTQNNSEWLASSLSLQSYNIVWIWMGGNVMNVLNRMIMIY